MTSNDYLEHTCNDRTPYTYLIGWSFHNKWYYGVRYAKGCHPSDLWVSYFTSSKHVKKFVEEYGHPDVVQIRRTFLSIDSARKWEHRVLKTIMVEQMDNWLNDHNGTCPSLESSIKGARAKKPYKEDDYRRNLSSERMKTPKMQKHIQENIEKMNSKEVRDKIKNKKRQRYDSGFYDEVLKKAAKKQSDTMKRLIADGVIIGIPFDSEFGKKMAERNNSDAECPHCGKVGQYRAMKRWHFDKCKKK